MLKNKKKINILPLMGVIVLHIGACFAPFTFSWPAFWVFVILYWMGTGLGVCLCYHRLLTHRSFKCPKWLEYLLTFFGCIASENGPITWVSTHRYHHANSDAEHDPHSPRHGFFWAHMLWFIRHTPLFEDDDFRSRYANDLVKDPVHQFLNRFAWVVPFIAGFALYAYGGWSFVIWGIFLRTVVALHVTWLVNSATHKWGYRSHKTKDDSKNLWWVAILGFGEGWHNNHHAFQHSARHGLRWWEFDMTYLTIKTLSFFKLVHSIRLPNLKLANAV